MHRRSYAVWWNEGDGRRHAGMIELGPLHALLSGNGSGRVAVPFDEIGSIDYARGSFVWTACEACRSRSAASTRRARCWSCSTR